jgi:putative MATE family efflux protein
MSETIEKNILGSAPIPKLLTSFAWPAIIAMVANALYNVVDQIFIGNAVGYQGITAATVTFPIVTIGIAVSGLIGIGASAFAAILLGQGKQQAAEEVLNTQTAAGAAIGLVLLCLGIFFLEPMLRLFGATEATMQYCKDLGGVYIIGMPVTMLMIGWSNMARTDGAPKLAMKALLTGVLLNCLLDPTMIFLFGWGVLGAGIATVVGQVVSTLILLRYFLRHSKLKFHRSSLLHPRLDLLKKSLAIGASSCLVQVSGTVMQIIMNNSLLYYGNLSTVGGDAAIGAMGIVMKVNMIFISISIGIGIGAGPIIGFNTGARRYDRVYDTYVLAVRYALLVTTLGWIACEFFPYQLLHFFGSSDAPMFLDFAADAMRIFMGGVFLAGFQIISTSYFQATGQAVKASLLSMLRQFFLIVPLTLVMPLFFGLYGILYAGLLADFLTTLIAALFIFKEITNLKKRTI